METNNNGHRPGFATPAPLTRSDTKIGRILQLLLAGHSLNRFDAERHNDHCLNTTVATLQAHGIVIDRHPEQVPCLGGRAVARVKRYWLDNDPANQARARQLLTRWAATP